VDESRIRIVIDPSGAKTGAQQAGAAFDQLKNSARGASKETDALGGSFDKLKRAAAGMFGAFSAGMIFRTFITNTSQAQTAMALLENTVRATGGAAGWTARELAELSQALQRVSTYGDEAIQGAMTRLLSYTSVQGRTFDRATRAVLDFATAFNVDLTQAAETVGKALEYPDRATEALSRQGYRFTESQQAQIKAMLEAGRVAEAQALILDELEQATKGAAEAARNTMGGAWRGLMNDVGDLFEISKGGSDALMRMFNGLAEAVRRIAPHMNQIVAAMAGLITAVTAAALVWGTYVAALRAVIIYHSVVAGAQAIAAFVSLARTIRTAADAMALFSIVSKGAVGAVAAIAAIAAGFVGYRKILAELNKETEAFEAHLAGLAGGGGAPGLPDEAALKRLAQARLANEDMLRLAEQGYQLALLEGLAQARQAVEYEATNNVIQAQRDLKGAILDETLAAIELERQWKLATVDAKNALEEQNKVVREQQQIIENMVRSLQSAFASVFERMLTNSRDVLGSIKSLFLRTITEIMAARVMKQFAGSLAGLIGVGAVAGRAGAQGVENLPPGAVTASDIAYVLPAIVAKASQSVLSQMLGYGGAAAGGFGIGYGIGQGASSAGTGGMGGALGGAAAGAAIGSVLPGIGTAAGAAAGALAGLVGGLMGFGKASRDAARAAREAEAQQREAMANWRQRLQDIGNPSILGESEFFGMFKELLGQFSDQKNFQGITKFTDVIAIFNKVMEQWPDAAQFDPFWSALSDLIDKHKDFIAAAQSAAVEDLEVRNLRAQGLNGEADALAAELRRQREMDEWIKRGFDEATLKALEYTHELERQAEAQKGVADAIRDVTSALNSPAGLRLSLLRWRATQTEMDSGVPTRGHVPGESAQRTAGVTVTGGITINIQQQPGEDAEALADRVLDAVDRKALLGNRGVARIARVAR
jgi:hypothetical protein